MKKIFFAIAITFGLNFVWEISQSFLYAPHYNGIGELISIHLWASGGDVVMVAVVLFWAWICAEKFLKKKKNSWQELSLIIFFGFLLSVSVEKYALTVGMWSYNVWMPMLPWLKVGLTPVLQMMIIPGGWQLLIGSRNLVERKK